MDTISRGLACAGWIYYRCVRNKIKLLAYINYSLFTGRVLLLEVIFEDFSSFKLFFGLAFVEYLGLTVQCHLSCFSQTYSNTGIVA